MKKIIQTMVAALVIAGMTGCATPYMIDRRRDAVDIFTATIGKGVGAGVRMGPTHVGLLVNQDEIGLRGGEFRGEWGTKRNGYGGWYDLLTGIPHPDGFFMGEEGFYGSKQSRSRGKWYTAKGVFPFVMLPSAAYPDEMYPSYFFSQIDIAVGVGLSTRLGFNPGELIDFILGWTTIDIYGDDLETKKQKEKSNQSSEATPKPGAPQ